MALHSLDELDEPSASLRILVALSGNPQGVTVTGLYRLMKGDYGLGRTAVDTSRRALESAGLVAEYRYDGGRRNMKIINLTDLGYVVVKKIIEISELMGQRRA